MSIIGHIGEYDSSKEEVVSYMERVVMFLEANGIETPARKRSVFLTTVGAQTYKLLRSLSNNKPQDKTFEELQELLITHLQPRPNVIAQRYKFFKRDRLPNESVSDYLAELRNLCEFCEFGDKLDEYIRDRLVCGINSERILQKLLSIKDLTLKTASDHAIAIETARKDCMEIQGRSAQGSSMDGQGAINKVESSPRRGSRRECFRCGDPRHMADTCPFKLKECFGCKKVGHTRRMCRSSEFRSEHERKERRRSEKDCHNVDVADHVADPVESLETWSLYPLVDVDFSRNDPAVVALQLNHCTVMMELDTGAAVSVMSLSAYRRVKKGKDELQETSLRLRTYTGELVRPAGVGMVDVSYQGQKCELPITVVKGNVPTLLGRDWLKTLKLDWTKLFPVVADIKTVSKCMSTEVEKLVSSFADVFSSKLGCLKDFKVHIPVPSDAQPRFFKARPVPYSLRARVEKELCKMEEQGIWKKVTYSKWAAPVVPVLKDSRDAGGAVRICGDYKLTVNQIAPLDTYPIPNINDQLASLVGGEKFSKLDLSQAYQQLEVDEETQELLTISTHRGLYQPKRLQFGVHSATGIFQRVMDQKLMGIPFVHVRVDDILVSGRNDAEHLENLKKVLKALSDAGLTLQSSKCSFLQAEVVYCGHIISKEGIKPMLTNVEAVTKAPFPTNVTELRAFLGMVNYYHGFLSNLSTVTEPLHNLLRKDVSWEWSKNCEEAFASLKKMLSEAPLLTHFDPSKPIQVHCDASPYGVGCVLSHVMLDGSERPVSFCSRTLSSAERNYAHIEKEGLSLVYGVKKFHQFLFGHNFTLVTDHKPLLGLFSECKGLPSRSSARILRWALLLAAYNYKLEYRPGSQHGNADGLSRLPLDFEPADVSGQVAQVRMLELTSSPVTEREVRQATRRDPVCSKVLCRVLEGWPSSVDSDGLADFKIHKDELTTESGCVLWGSRVLIPRGLQGRVLEMLHAVHPGMSRMKALARCYVWWPGIDREIETMIRSCLTCQQNQAKPPGAPVHPWEHPEAPWERVHVDFAGPLDGKMYLLLVDAFSRWLEVIHVKAPSSQVTVQKLRRVFATHGLPSIVVSDNGTAFTSEVFAAFMMKNGIHHVRTAPYHPASNGQVERYVRTFKESLKTLEGDDVETKLDRLLFHYRTTPHSVTGSSPAELLMHRKLRTPLDQLRPGRAPQRKAQEFKQRTSSHLREFENGDQVLTVNFSTRNRCKWLPGTVCRRLGSTNYEVQLVEGGTVHRHIDQMVLNHTDQRRKSVFTEPELLDQHDVTAATGPAEEGSSSTCLVPISVQDQPVPSTATTEAALGDSVVLPEATDDVPPRRSARERRVPARYADYQ